MPSFVVVNACGEDAREALISGLKICCLWDPRIGLLQRGVGLTANSKLLRMEVTSAEYAEELARMILAKDWVDSYSCFVHTLPIPWQPDMDSPFGGHEFILTPTFYIPKAGVHR